MKGEQSIKNVIVFALHGGKDTRQYFFPVGKVQHFYFRTDQIDVRRNDVQSLDIRSIDGIARICVIDDTFIDRAVYFRYVYSQTGRRIGLRIRIDKQDLFFSNVAKEAARFIEVVVFPTPPF